MGWVSGVWSVCTGVGSRERGVCPIITEGEVCGGGCSLAVVDRCWCWRVAGVYL